VPIDFSLRSGRDATPVPIAAPGSVFFARGGVLAAVLGVADWRRAVDGMLSV
jgi:hypothetical protein